MKPFKIGAHMSQQERLAVVETTMVNMKQDIVEMKQDMKDLRHDMKHGMKHLSEEIRRLSDNMDKKFSILEGRIWTHFVWLMSMIIGLAGLIAKTQHWI